MWGRGPRGSRSGGRASKAERPARVPEDQGEGQRLWKHCVGATSGVWVNVRRVRSCEAMKLRSAEAPKHRNAETPKRRSSEVLKLRNVETLRRRRFWDGEKLRNSETPKRRNAEAPKRRGIVTPRHHGPRRFISGCEPPKLPRLRSAAASKHENARNPRNAEALRASEVVRLWLWARGSGGGSVVAANLRTSEPPNRRTAGGHSAHDPEYANLANSSPERGQQPGEEVNLGGVRRKGCHPRGTESDCSVVAANCRTAESPNRRIAEAPDRRVAETPDCRIAETLDLRITGHLSRRTYEAPKVVRRAPEVVRPIVDVGSEKGLRRLVATRRYWDAYGGTGRNVGASGGMRTGGTGCLQAVGCAEQARKGGVPLTSSPLLAVAPRHSVRRPRRTRGKKIRGSLKLQIDLRGFKSPKRRNSERRNAEIPYTEVPKLRNAETSKLQNTEVPKSPKFQRPPGSETPKTRGLRPDMFRGFGRGNAGSSAAVYEESAPGCSGSGGVLERKLKAGVSERSAKDFGGSSAVGTNLRNSERRSAETPDAEAPKRRNSERRSAEIPNAEAQELRTPKRRNSGHKMAKLRNVKGSCYGSERRNLRNRRNLRDTEAPKSSKTPKISEAIRDVPEALVTSGRTAEVNDQPPAEVRDRPRTCHKGSGKLGIDRIGREGAMAGSVGGSGGKGNGGAFEARPGNHWTSGGAGSARPGQGRKGNENEMAHRAKGWPAEGMGGGVGKGGGEHTATCRTLFSRDPRAHPPASLRRPLHLEHTGRLHGAQSKPGSGRGAEPAGGDLVLLRLGRGESLELATTRQRVSTHLGRGESLENEEQQAVRCILEGSGPGVQGMWGRGPRGSRSGGRASKAERPARVPEDQGEGQRLWKHCVGATSGVWVNVRRVRSCEAMKLRSAEAPKHRNAETPKRRSSEVLKLRNVETLRRRRFWDGEKLRNSETPKRRNAEAPKRRGIVTPRHHGPRRFISGCEPPKLPRLRSAAASKHENARNPRNAEALRASEVVRLWL
ncbi:hypothetical protein GGX14DRAFT_402713 [Mycena pura]|uniref:Uncharacterized protein n=1 Tax=Mycena pura TaxID=153505 RepID=A0AAD6UXT8_9AGAR|nr:hypothetical protein GGX14DRAFT_402713 [Mycena pura]